VLQAYQRSAVFRFTGRGRRGVDRVVGDRRGCWAFVEKDFSGFKIISDCPAIVLSSVFATFAMRGAEVEPCCSELGTDQEQGGANAGF